MHIASTICVTNAETHHYSTILSAATLHEHTSKINCRREGVLWQVALKFSKKCTDLHLLLGELEVKSVQVAPDVALACGLRDHTGTILDGPPDQNLQRSCQESVRQSA